jgi:hypothetical protein
MYKASIPALEHASLDRMDPTLNLQGRLPTHLRATLSAWRRRPLGGWLARELH